MLKILLVYYEPIPSGQTTHVLSLIRGLDPSRFHLTVALPTHLETCCGDDFRRAGARVIPLAMRKLFWAWAAAGALTRLIQQEQFDIVHVHSQEAGIMGRLIAWQAGVKRIFYTPQTIDIRRSWMQSLYGIVELILSWLTERIISVNDVDRRRMIGWGIRAEKIHTVPNGIDLRPFRPAREVADRSARLKLGLNFAAGDQLVMQVGRLAVQKDPAAFVEGAALVLQKKPQTRFVMIGEGPLANKMEELARSKGLADKVLLLGRRSDACQLMAGADVVTLTSRWEGTPYSILEAMAWQKPVVVTAVNGCQELVLDGKTGFMVNCADPAAWADRVVQLLEDEDLRTQFGQRGRERVAELYSLEVMIDKIGSLYRLVPDPSMEKALQTR